MPSLSTMRRRASRHGLRLSAVHDRSPHAVMHRYVLTVIADDTVILGGGLVPGVSIEDCIRYLDQR